MAIFKKPATGGITSLLIGMPIGLIAMFFMFLLPAALTGDGFLLFVLSPMLSIPSLGFLISFFVSLWIAGEYAANNLQKNQALLLVSFKYSALVNVLVWLVFFVLFLLNSFGIFPKMILLSVVTPLLLAIFGTLISTFTTGLIICYAIKKKLDGTEEDL
ncbi:MAG: hypothetical protein IT236_09835 [Bacteroidia bacterium]|nr:hypothetical protein [Bacteroidia bacterium]